MLAFWIQADNSVCAPWRRTLQKKSYFWVNENNFSLSHPTKHLILLCESQELFQRLLFGRQKKIPQQVRESMFEPGKTWQPSIKCQITKVTGSLAFPMFWNGDSPQAPLSATVDLTSTVTAGKVPMVTVKMKHTDRAITQIW